MAARQNGQLCFGTLGEVRYDSSSTSWRIKRRLGEDIHLRIISTRQIQSAPTGSIARDDAADTKKQLRSQTRTMVLRDPLLGALEDALPALAQPSGLIVRTSAEFDASVANLAALGHARIKTGRREVAYPILAIVDGVNGDCLRLARFEPAPKLISGPPQTELLVSMLDSINGTKWQAEKNSPIQQICSSASNYFKGDFLALRNQSGTVVLYPVWNVPSDSLTRPDLDTQLSRPSLDANPVLHIPLAWTGCAVHLDVAFNPRDQNVLLILDSRGQWTIFRIQLLYQGGPSVIPQLTSASRPGIRMVPESGVVCDDQWGKAVWLADGSAFIVCDHTNLVIVHISKSPAMAFSPNLGLQNEDELILDLKCDHAKSGAAFVLTTLRLIWMRTSVDQETESSRFQETFPHVIVSWNHAWAAKASLINLATASPQLQDQTLGADSNRGCSLAMIYSRSSTVLEVFVFGLDAASSTESSLADPMMISFATDQSTSARKPVHPVSIIILGVTQVSGSGNNHEGVSDVVAAQYFQVIAISDECEVVELLLACNAPGTSIRSHPQSKDQPKKRGRLPKEESDRKLYLSLFERSRAARQIINLRWLAQESVRSFATREMEMIKPRDIPNNLGILCGHLNGCKYGISPLNDLLTKPIVFENIKEASTVLVRKLFPERGPTSSPCDFVSLLTTDMQAALTGQTPFSKRQAVQLVDMYNHIRHSWAARYPKNILEETRFDLEANLREMAQDVFLSSVGARKPQTLLPPVTASQSESQSHFSQVESQKDVESQSRSRGLSSQTQSQDKSSLSVAPYQPVDHLSALVSVPDHEPLSSQLSLAVGEWHIGSDPSLYDWEGARRVTAFEAATASEVASASQSAPASQRVTRQSQLQSQATASPSAAFTATHKMKPERGASQSVRFAIPERLGTVANGVTSSSNNPASQQTQSSEDQNTQASQVFGTQASAPGSQRPKKKQRRQGF